MNLNKKIGLFLFIIISLCFIYFRVISNQQFDNIFKSLFVVSALVYYSISVKKIDYSYIAALIFFFVGDIIFFSKSNSALQFFMGLSAYFLAILSILLIATNRIYIGFGGKKYLAYGLIPLVILTMVYYLFRNHRLNIILVLYSLSFTFLFCFAIYYYLKEQNKTSLWLLYGSIFLMSCNIFAAINRLDTANKNYYIISGISYVLALFFITNSLIESNSNNIKSSEQLHN